LNGHGVIRSAGVLPCLTHDQIAERLTTPLGTIKGRYPCWIYAHVQGVRCKHFDSGTSPADRRALFGRIPFLGLLGEPEGNRRFRELIEAFGPGRGRACAA